MTASPIAVSSLPDRVIDCLDLAIFAIDADEPHYVRYVNASAEQLMGRTAPELVGQSLWRLLSIVAPPFNIIDAQVDGLTFSQAVQLRRSVQLVQSVTPRTQGAFVSQLMDVHLHALPDSPQLVVTFRDMGWAWQKLRDNHLSSSALEAISEAVMITDPQGLIVRVNRAFTDLTGYSAEDVVDQTPRILKSGRHDREFYRDLWNHLLSRGSWAGEVWDKAKSGRIYPKWISIFSVYEGRRLAYYVSIFSDLTVKRNQRRRHWEALYMDPLTGLANRRQLLQEAARPQWQSQYCALAIFDLDRFKQINDSLGFVAGDQLLIDVAQRLRAVHFEGASAVFRSGDNQFALLLQPVADEATMTGLVAQIKQQLEEDYLLADRSLHLSVSAGFAVSEEPGGSLLQLLQQAELALHRARRDGRSQLRSYAFGMDVEVRHRLQLEHDLRLALASTDQLHLVYQPQWSVGRGRGVGYEALVRWNHPVHGYLSPAVFVPVAEDADLIVPLGQWVLNEASRQARVWLDAGINFGTIAVNVSALQFLSSDFAQQVLDTLLRHRVPPCHIELEITESVLLDQPHEVVATMQRLVQAGLRFALDDFGTGYSSLSYLRRLPVQKLKLDRSFVVEGQQDEGSQAIVHAVLRLAKVLGITTIAEGVETEDQLAMLSSMGCDLFQGYLFGRPLAADQVVAAQRQP